MPRAYGGPRGVEVSYERGTPVGFGSVGTRSAELGSNHESAFLESRRAVEPLASNSRLARQKSREVKWGYGPLRTCWSLKAARLRRPDALACERAGEFIWGSGFI